MASSLSDETADELLRVCRATIGDELRSLTYFTRDEYEHLYLRKGLDRGDDPLAFVETERLGFTSRRTYEREDLGEYEYTIRVFQDGHIIRVITGGRGVYATTDALTMERFDETAEAIGELLEGTRA